MRFPHLAHRSAAAHKLHSTPQQDRMNLISGKNETSSRLPGPFSLLLPGSCPTTGTVAVLQDIITGYEEHLPFAREMLTNMERMTTAEREAFIAGNSSRDSKKLEPFPRWDPR